LNTTIALLLGQDGLTNGIIYALVSIALLLVFVVTRILLVPQGEFVALGALTLVQLGKGQSPSVLWLLFGLAGAAVAVSAARSAWHSDWRLMPTVAVFCAVALALGAATVWLIPALFAGLAPLPVRLVATVILVAPLGPMLYWTAFQGVARASILTLLFAAVSVHYVLQGLMLPLFGPEGFQAEAMVRGRVDVGVTRISLQLLLTAGSFALAVTALWLFFGRTVRGKILRATAINPRGARIVGIRPETSGALAFGLASVLGAISGILIAPLTTFYYDSGFLLALKGFVGAVVGGLVSFPLAAGGSLLLGILEALFSFHLSALKDSLVFAALLPILLIRSVRHLSDRAAEEEE
jgi:branched-chain amino acid transport system permease protein